MPPSPGRGHSRGAGTADMRKHCPPGAELFERLWVKNYREGTAVMGSVRSLTDNRASPVTIWEVRAAPVRWARILRLRRRQIRSTAAACYSYSFSMDFGAGRFESRIGGGSQESSGRLQAAGEILERNSSRFSRLQQRRFAPVRDRSCISRLAKSVPGQHRSVVIQSSRAQPTCLVWIRTDRRYPRRGN